MSTKSKEFYNTTKNGFNTLNRDPSRETIGSKVIKEMSINMFMNNEGDRNVSSNRFSMGTLSTNSRIIQRLKSKSSHKPKVSQKAKDISENI